MAIAETCAHCAQEIGGSEARTTRYTLEHLTMDQRTQFHRIMGWDTMPALLCASCLMPILSQANASIHAARQSKTST